MKQESHRLVHCGSCDDVIEGYTFATGVTELTPVPSVFCYSCLDEAEAQVEQRIWRELQSRGFVGLTGAFEIDVIEMKEIIFGGANE